MADALTSDWPEVRSCWPIRAHEAAAPSNKKERIGYTLIRGDSNHQQIHKTKDVYEENMAAHDGILMFNIQTSSIVFPIRNSKKCQTCKFKVLLKNNPNSEKTFKMFPLVSSGFS